MTGLRLYLPFLPLFLLLTPLGRCQSDDDCPDVGRQHVVGPEDEVESTECAQIGFSFHVKIGAGGSIGVVDADVEGAVEVSYSSPASCRTSVVTYDGDIHECATGHSKQYCNPRAYTVNVKKFQNLDPCPPTNIVAIIRDFITSGGSLPDCGELTEVDLGTDSVRYSAQAFSCKDRTRVEPIEGTLQHGGLMVGGDSTYQTIWGAPAASIPEPTGSSSGLDWLIDYLSTGNPENLPAPVHDIALASPPVEAFERLSVTATFTWFDVPGYGTLINHYEAVGEFRRDGTYHLLLPGSGLDEDGNMVSYTEEWTRDEAALYFSVTGNPQGLVFPVEGGFADERQGFRLPFATRVQRWMDNPFRISPSLSAQFATTTEGDSLETVMTFAGDAPVVGASKVWVVRASAPSRPVSSRVYSLQGVPLEEVEYSDYRPIGPDVWRPMSLVERHYDPETGALAKMVVLRYDGYVPEPGTPTEELTLPRPTHSRWFIKQD